MDFRKIKKEYSSTEGPAGLTETRKITLTRRPKETVKITLIRHPNASEWVVKSVKISGSRTPGDKFPTPEELRRLAVSGDFDFEKCPLPPVLSRRRAREARARVLPGEKILSKNAAKIEPDFSADDLAEQLTRALLGESPDEPNHTKETNDV